MISDSFFKVFTLYCEIYIFKCVCVCVSGTWLVRHKHENDDVTFAQLCVQQRQQRPTVGRPTGESRRNCYCCGSFGNAGSLPCPHAPMPHCGSKHPPLPWSCVYLMCVVDRASVNLLIWRLKIELPNKKVPLSVCVCVKQWRTGFYFLFPIFCAIRVVVCVFGIRQATAAAIKQKPIFSWKV